ncbi:hypothetical protein SBDP1_710002 [Syntrophobacter sp. SbD1]|nr:hypothetical protein SBDP1_710002 [Syntrophobacter sp. SbD1]
MIFFLAPVFSHKFTGSKVIIECFQRNTLKLSFVLFINGWKTLIGAIYESCLRISSNRFMCEGLQGLKSL